MQTLYPPIKTYAEHRLEVSDRHTIYVEECGIPDGIPILVVHSGPGAGSDSYYRRYFDPEVYRIILFDQRGAGRSTPYAELEENTTEHLIADMEAIRTYLGVEKWVLFGASWGAALSILYSQQYPDQVNGLILHSSFLGRRRDIQWFYQEGANRLFPDYYHDFTSHIPEEEHQDIIKAYYERLTGNDDLARMSAAKAWSLWQARCSSLQPHHNILEHFSDPHFAVGLSRIECHYLVNQCFLEPNQILDDIQAIQDIPGYVIHGRYDCVCPLSSAWELHQSWNKSELFIVRDAGHSGREPGIIDAVILATKNMAKRLK